MSERSCWFFVCAFWVYKGGGVVSRKKQRGIFMKNTHVVWEASE